MFHKEGQGYRRRGICHTLAPRAGPSLTISESHLFFQFSLLLVLFSHVTPLTPISTSGGAFISPATPVSSLLFGEFSPCHRLLGSWMLILMSGACGHTVGAHSSALFGGAGASCRNSPCWPALCAYLKHSHVLKAPWNSKRGEFAVMEENFPTKHRETGRVPS